VQTPEGGHGTRRAGIPSGRRFYASRKRQRAGKVANIARARLIARDDRDIGRYIADRFRQPRGGDLDGFDTVLRNSPAAGKRQHTRSNPT